ncbi:MAG: hypothetical protein AAFQ77_01520 [Myxococcota bacterium]
MSLPHEREAQGAWIAAELRSWQTAWHDIFDRDAALLADGEFDRPNPLPDSIDTDYRLIFGLSQATSVTRTECLGLLPSGAELARRFDRHREASPTRLREAEVRHLVERLAKQVDACAPNESAPWSEMVAIHDDDPRAANTDPVSILLERSLIEPDPPDELPAIAARIFLSEPLYAFGGNSREPADWITAAMFGAEEDAVYTTLYDLWTGGWQVLIAEDAILLRSLS